MAFMCSGRGCVWTSQCCGAGVVVLHITHLIKFLQINCAPWVHIVILTNHYSVQPHVIGVFSGTSSSTLKATSLSRSCLTLTSQWTGASPCWYTVWGWASFCTKNSKGGPWIINKVCYWQVLNVLALYVSTKNWLILSLFFFVAPNDNPGAPVAARAQP